MNIADLRIGREIPLLKRAVIGIVAAGTIFTIYALVAPVKATFASAKEANQFTVLRMIQVLLMVSIVTTMVVANKILKGQMNPLRKRAAFTSFEARYYTASVIRLSGIAGNVFFGAFIILTMPVSVRQSDPSWYLHLLPLLLLWGMAYYVFPSAGKVDRYKSMYEAEQPLNS